MKVVHHFAVMPETIGKKRLKPLLLKIIILVENLKKQTFINLKKFDLTPRFSFAFGWLLICEVVWIDNASDTSHQMEIFKFLLY